MIRLLVVAVVALDGERPAMRSLPDDYSIVAQHRVVSARASRRPLRVCAGGLFRSGLVSFGKRLAPPRLTKARSRRSRLDVSAFSSGAAQAAVSPIGLTIGSVLGKDTGERVRFMRTGYCGGSRRIRGTRLGPPEQPKRLRHVTQLVTLLGRF